MKTKILLAFLMSVVFVSCHEVYEHKTVICIPVYGQSLALGEEAVRITDFDSLSVYADGRIVTENLDHNYGYFDNDDLRRFAKKVVRYQKRSFELTVYSMAEMLADSLGKDTIICTFPGGQGTTDISHLGKGSLAYQKFIDNIKAACDEAKERGWEFVVPALCWMQGETDVADYSETDYRELLLQFFDDVNKDVRLITGQSNEVEFICYQTTSVSRASNFNSLAFDCREMKVPQTLLDLVHNIPSFHASGPTYPYDFVREAIHIDGLGHIRHGKLVALAALDILHNRSCLRGLLPIKVDCQGQNVIVELSVPCPPMVFDTLAVSPATNYGFSVITPDNRDIVQMVSIQGNSVYITCSEHPDSCRVRYAVNGEKMKSGRLHGPRGNLRDSQGDSFTITVQGKAYPIHNWCWQFDIPITQLQLSSNSVLPAD